MGSNPGSERPARPIDKLIDRVVILVAFAMIAFHVFIVWSPAFGELMNQNTHLGFCMVLLFLQGLKVARSGWKSLFSLVGALVSLSLVIYVAVNYERLDMESGFPNPTDVEVGVLLIASVLYLTWRGFGAVFPVMVLVGISYAIWGDLVPGVMGHAPLEFGYIVSNLSVGLQGIYGMLLNVSVNILFLLVIFGSIFESTGVTKFFMEFGTLLSRYLKGGTGQTAIFSSSFVGMANGVAVANVAITGSYTIPAMKKSGFREEIAGAIEAMASTGGQLTPPIMGIAVFLMANFLGTSYSELMTKALLPAVAYYAIAVGGVMLIASRDKIPRSTALVDKKLLLVSAPIFLVPMVVLTLLLFWHYSAGYAAFWASVSLILVSLLISLFQAEIRLRGKVLLRNLVQGAVMAAGFGAAVACIGIFVKCMTLTGATTKLSLVITDLSGTSLLLALVLTMLLAILLSSSTPTVIAYVVVAFLAAPILTEMGVSKIVAHFFVFYFAVLAAITPPVAGAAIVGSQIAKVGYMKTAWESFKLVGPFFLLPYFLVHNPVLLSEPQPWGEALMALSALALAMGSMMFCCQRYLLTRLRWFEIVLFLATAILATSAGIYTHAYLLLAAAAVMAVGLGLQWRARRSPA